MTNVNFSAWALADLTTIGVWSFVLCAVSILCLLPLSRAVGLVDVPDQRKQHFGSIPLIGGISITITVTLMMLGLGAFAEPSMYILLGVGGILAALGVLDDYADISARYRLVVQIAVGLALCFIANLKIISVGDLTGNGFVVFGSLMSILFTIMCSVGVFNAINMIDGHCGICQRYALCGCVGIRSMCLHGVSSLQHGCLW